MISVLAPSKSETLRVGRRASHCEPPRLLTPCFLERVARGVPVLERVETVCPGR